MTNENLMMIIIFTACGNDIEKLFFYLLFFYFIWTRHELTQYILRDMILKVKQWKNYLGKYKGQV